MGLKQALCQKSPLKGHKTSYFCPLIMLCVQELIIEILQGFKIDYVAEFLKNKIIIIKNSILLSHFSYSRLSPPFPCFSPIFPKSTHEIDFPVFPKSLNRSLHSSTPLTSVEKEHTTRASSLRYCTHLHLR